jgi:replicative DNA helicase
MNALAEIRHPLPVNLEAEQQVLGAILLNNDALAQIIGYLRPQHFHEPLHRRIYQLCLDLRQAGRLATPITIMDGLPADQAIGDINVRLYVAELVGGCVGVAMAEDFARTVFNTASRRNLIAFGEDAKDAAANAPPDASPSSLVADLEAKLFEIGRDAQRLTGGTSSRTAGEFGAALLRRLNGEDKPQPPIRTCFADLDHIIGGLRRGDLSILAGRPGMMKTGLATSLTLNVAANDLPVLFFSMEMTGDALGARMLGDLCYTSTLPIWHQHILDQQVKPDRIEEVQAQADRLARMPITIDTRRGLSAAEICLRIRRWAAFHRRKGREPGVAIIDHLGKVRPTGRTDNRSLELGEITTALAEEAGESNVPILCLCQLNRAAESRDNKRPQLSDLRESGRIEEDARVVMGVYRESYYLQKRHETDVDREIKRVDDLETCKHDLEVIVLKNSHGAEGNAKLWVHVPSGAIRDREHRI